LIEIRLVDGAATQELRRAVLRPYWPIGSPMHGDENPDAVHIAALNDGELVGCCLILPRPFPIRPDEPGGWQLRGMATVARRQGTGIGSQVVAAALAEGERRAGRFLWCDARTTAVPFYRKHGFATEGDEFLHAESGTPHYRMWRMI
jgi:predicted GNAT family N-acyltransferase